MYKRIDQQTAEVTVLDLGIYGPAQMLTIALDKLANYIYFKDIVSLMPVYTSDRLVLIVTLITEEV